MDELDIRIKELSKSFRIPDGFDKRIDSLLDALPPRSENVAKNNAHGRNRFRMLYAAAACFLVLCIGTVIIGNTEAGAKFFQIIGLKISEFFGSAPDEDTGVGTKQVNRITRGDITIRMQEFTMDKNTIYLNLLVSAPKEVTFTEKVDFDYFGICRGKTYDPEQLLGGARSMKYLGMVAGKENTAQYILNLSTNEVIRDGDPLVVFFDDLTLDPNSDAPQALVEGHWELPFTAEGTVPAETAVPVDEETTYPILGKTATVKDIDVSPLGITIVSDMSEFPEDELGVSDTRIEAVLHMADGSERILSTRRDDITPDVESGSIATENKDDKVYMTYTFTFEKPVKTADMRSLTIEGVEVLIPQE